MADLAEITAKFPIDEGALDARLEQNIAELAENFHQISLMYIRKIEELRAERDERRASLAHWFAHVRPVEKWRRPECERDPLGFLRQCAARRCSLAEWYERHSPWSADARAFAGNLAAIRAAIESAAVELPPPSLAAWYRRAWKAPWRR